MALYNIEKSNKLKKERKKPFTLEKEIQKLVEENLDVLLNISFVSSELTYNKLRMDTLAFDENQNSFVIIEYKNKADPGLSDQGFAYYSLLNSHPEFFVLEYNKKTKEQLSLKDIDWRKSRIIFISPDFTAHQEAIDTTKLPFELWKIERYEGSIISLEPLNIVDEEASNINSTQKTDTKYERLEYSENDHLDKASKDVKSLYRTLRENILSLGEDVELVPKKKYLAFKAATNFADLELAKSTIKCHINMNLGELEDPKRKARDVSNIGHYGNGDYEIKISKKEEIEYLMGLIRQSYEKNK